MLAGAHFLGVDQDKREIVDQDSNPFHLSGVYTKTKGFIVGFLKLGSCGWSGSIDILQLAYKMGKYEVKIIKS